MTRFPFKYSWPTPSPITKLCTFMVNKMVIASLELPEIDVERVGFNRFWARSRYTSIVPGLDLAKNVKTAFDEMERDGGYVTFMTCTWRGHFGGSLAVFKDPWYRSKGRDNVACFGLVTATNTAMLDLLVNAARQDAASNGFRVLRGPVNPPRYLLGYGVQLSGYNQPVIAGTSADPEMHAALFEELDEGGTFDGKDTYYNLLQDFKKNAAYIDGIDLDRSLRVVNPDLDNIGDLAGKVADMMNASLGYRPDYMLTNAQRLADSAMAYNLIPGGEKLLAFYFDGDTLAGGTIMQPDWFEVLAGKPLTAVVGEIYMLAPAYQGKWLMMNFSEYAMATCKALGIGRIEHASIWEGSHGALATVKHGLNTIIKMFRVYELHA
jgi:hypothetical protein